MLGLLLWALAANTEAHLPNRADCSLKRLTACGTTNDLVWARDFEPAIKSFAGKSRTDALGGQSEALWKSLMWTLGGPPDEPIELIDGNLLFTACVAHNCTEKGAIVIKPDGVIVAAAMLTNHFEQEDRLPLGDQYSRLDFFLPTPVSGESAWHTAIVVWAKTAYRADQEVFEKYWHNTGLTETVWLITPTSKSPQKLSSMKIIENPAK